MRQQAIRTIAAACGAAAILAGTLDTLRAQEAVGGAIPRTLPEVLPVPESAAGMILPELARSYVDALASDAMLGRNTPSPELDSAARYISSMFQAFGLEPVSGSYFHEYYLKQQDLGTRNALSVNGRARELRTAFVPYEFSGTGAVAGSAVFVGFGISRSDSSYDDYAGIDVRGKIVVAISGEPTSEDGKQRFTAEGSAREKMLTAARHGAAGFLLLTNPLQSKFLRPGGYPWRSFFKKPNGKLPPLTYQLDLPGGARAIPAVGISGDVAKDLFGRSVEDITAMARRIDSAGRPASVALPGTVEMEVDIVDIRTPVRNVVGMVRGRLLPDEFVVIGAHYDHVGHFAPSTREETGKADTIYNGADDNASGTAGLMLAARAFGSLPMESRPARSILFIAFSGEEKGLYGSRAYVASPLAPIDSTVAMLNMDMIGRNNRDSISVAGRTRSKDMTDQVEAANGVEPMKLAYDLEDMFGRSDQASFASRGVPVVFFSSGLHADYHQVTDSPEKIDAVKLAHVARLCFRTAFLVAESPTRPRYHVPEGDAGSYFD